MKKIISFLIRNIPRKHLQRFAALGVRVLGFFYTGRGVHCPVCGHEYRKFLPYGRKSSRANALCPNCLSLERHRLIWLYLRERTAFFSKKMDVLHIAPEACFIRRFEAQHGERYITADIESPLAKVKMDIHDMPFRDASFDVVLCNHVLEHVRDDIRALGEIRRVLRDGGFAILQVPFFNPVPEKTIEDPTVTDPRQRELLFGQDDHVRKYGMDYADRIRKAGLIAEADDFVNSFDATARFRNGLAAGELIYKGIKKKQGLS